MREIESIFLDAVRAVDPESALASSVRRCGEILVAGRHSFDLSAFERIFVVGAGKAAAKMAKKMEEILGDRITEGLVVTKYGHGEALRFIGVAEASHPIPDESGMMATGRILDLANRADEKALLVCLLSGGASALLVSPAGELVLEDKKRATSLLLGAGADILETNCVRKHLSRVKGGNLARAAHPARILSLVLSDVIGDRFDVIASGPTCQDESTYADALEVISGFGLSMPPRVMEHLTAGAKGRFPETVKEGDPCLENASIVLLANLVMALDAAEKCAGELGFMVERVSNELSGEARDAGVFLANLARERLDRMGPGQRICLLSGGETTVKVRGKGKGGRNQELALAFAISIEGISGISFLSAGTDGGDGPTDAAGAIVDGGTVELAEMHGLDPDAFLGENDSYGFFSRLDAASGSKCHFRTGPTGTNVMDIQIVLLGKGP